MSKESLKRLRIIIPGVILYLSFAPLFIGTINPITIIGSFNIKDSIYLIPVLILGVLYYAIDLRGFFLRPSLGAIHWNLQERVLSAFRTEPVIFALEDRLRKKRIILDIFYSFIDNDESLRERAKNIYFNGLIWTSFTDIIAISALAAPIYGVAYLVTNNVDHIALAAGFLLALLAAGFCLQPRVQSRHIELQNEQIDYILALKKDKLRQRLIQAVGNQ